MSSTQSSNNKRIAKNTIYLYLRMLLSMVVSLYTSRVVLDVLGVSDYGVYGGLIEYYPKSRINNRQCQRNKPYISTEATS